jgi:hypothetical protein
MRELQNDDMYLLSEIADKMDFTLPKAPVMDKKNMQEAQKEYGMQIITLLIKRLYRAKNEINQLIANVTEKSIDEVSKMSIKETIDTFKKILTQDGVLDFFK